MENKSFEARHLHRTNRMTFILLTMVNAMVVLSIFMFSSSKPISTTVISLVVALAGVVISIIGRVKFVDSDKGHLVMFVGIALNFIVLLWTNLEYPYVCSITFLICLVVMFYKDVRMSYIGASLAIFVNIVFTVLYVLKTDMSQIAQVASTDLMIIMGCIIAVLAIRQMNSMEGEVLDEVKKQAAEMEESSKGTMEKSLQIKELLSSANDNVGELANSINISADTMNKIASASRETVASVEVQKEMASNITTSIKAVDAVADEMSAAHEESVKAIKEGNDSINLLKQQSINVANINQSTAELTNALQERAIGIKEVVNTILSISSQTNLLSLNASIEAARAGEAGKGFAVVADEIRSLSDSTNESAQQISAVIDQLVDNIASASRNMNSSVEATQKEAQLIDETRTAFENIDKTVETLSLAVNELKEKMEEMEKSNIQVIESTERLEESANEMSASAEESIEITNTCVRVMDDTNKVLGEIFEISEKI